MRRAEAFPVGGQTFTYTFDTAGRMAYHGSIHPFMTGTIVVR
jgi:plastocyanin